MIAERVKKGFDAKLHWLDQPDSSPLSIEVKDFAGFIIEVFDLQPENLDVPKYVEIVNDSHLFDKLSVRVQQGNRAALEHYRNIDNSSLKFYIEHSILCLTLRYEVLGKTAPN